MTDTNEKITLDELHNLTLHQHAIEKAQLTVQLHTSEQARFQNAAALATHQVQTAKANMQKAQEAYQGFLTALWASYGLKPEVDAIAPDGTIQREASK